MGHTPHLLIVGGGDVVLILLEMTLLFVVLKAQQMGR